MSHVIENLCPDCQHEHSGLISCETHKRIFMSPVDGVELIAKERKRQIEQEGWTPEDDDQKHPNGQLARAAENYVRFAAEPDVARDYQRENGHTPGGWPWHYSWWKPSIDNTPASKIRELQKAGALIAAEIDRLQRIQQKEC